MNLISLTLSAYPGQINNNEFLTLSNKEIEPTKIIFKTKEDCEVQVKDYTKQCHDIGLWNKIEEGGDIIMKRNWLFYEFIDKTDEISDIQREIENLIKKEKF